MKTTHKIQLMIAVLVVFGLPTFAAAQRKPALRRPAPRVVAVVPTGTNLKVRLNDTLSSKESRAGDKFTATVIDPVRFDEATVSGHIRSIDKSSRIKGRTTINLAFDSVELRDGKRGTLHGYVTNIYGAKARTDQEGGVQSDGRGNQTLKRAGIGAAAGAILGGIIGGGKGAGIGLILGGAGGAGSIAIKGSKELKLESGTEMLVRVTR